MQCITKSLASFHGRVSPNANIPLSAFLRWKVCLNQLIFEVYSLDSLRFKSFESTCLSAGRQKGAGLSFHCSCWTMEQCSCNNTHSASVWDFISENVELKYMCMFRKKSVSCKNMNESLFDISLSSQGPDISDQSRSIRWGEWQPDVVVGVSGHHCAVAQKSSQGPG